MRDPMPQADAVLTTLDPFALGGRAEDPTPAELWAQYKEIDSRLDVLEEQGDMRGGESDRLIKQQVAIEEKISAAVTSDPASLIAQMRLLVQYAQHFDWGECEETIAERVIAGLERLDRHGTMSVALRIPSEDPVAPLAAERHRLNAEGTKIVAWGSQLYADDPREAEYDAQINPIWDALSDVEAEMMETVATTKAGLIAQVDLLHERLDLDDRPFVETLKAGIAGLRTTNS